MGSTGPHGQHRAYSPSGRRPRSLLLTDPHLGVVRLWLLLHIRTVIFKGVVFIWKPQQLQRYNWTREATAVRIARTSGRRPKTPDPNSSVHSEYPPELNSPPHNFYKFNRRHIEASWIVNFTGYLRETPF